MPDRLPDALTPVDKGVVLTALARAWHDLTLETPKRESICCLAAQWALETGWGHSMHCFNFGNVKSAEGDGRDFTYFACNEIMPLRQAQGYASRSPNTAKITKVRSDGTAVIWFYPDHAACRFRAFKTMREGAADYLGLLRRRFVRAWPQAAAGDPAAFADALHAQGYFTADLDDHTEADGHVVWGYRRSLVSIYKGLVVTPFEMPADSPEPATDDLTPDEKTRLLSLVSVTADELVREILDPPPDTLRDAGLA